MLNKQNKIKDNHPFFAIEAIADMCKEVIEKNKSPHLHNYYSIYWIQKGEVIHATNFVEYTIIENSLLFIPADLEHRMIIEKSCIGIAIFFNDAFFNLKENDKREIANSTLFNNADFRSVIQLENYQMPYFKSIIDLIQVEYKNDDIYKTDIIISLIKTLLLISKRLYDNQHQDITEDDISHQNAIIIQFKNLIDNNFIQLKNVSAYANLLNIQSVFLNEITKKNTGITAGELIRNKIMKEAKKMLYASDLNAKEISYQLGYEDTAYFHRFFKKYTGQTMTEFRTLSRKKSS